LKTDKVPEWATKFLQNLNYIIKNMPYCITYYAMNQTAV